MDAESVTPEPIKRRADGLSVGDRILPAYLPAVGDEPAEVLFVKPYTYVHEAWIFVAFEMPTGLIEATHYKSDGGVEIYPAPDPTGQTYSRADDGETTQPIAGRVPLHFGALVNEGGHTAVQVAGGLIEIDPPVCLGRDMDCGRTLPCPNHPANGVVRCATSESHAPHRTTFAPEMGITNGICPGRCTQECIDMAVPTAPQDARKGWHDDDCPAVIDIADVQ